MTRKRWKNPDKRMARAVELRQRGMSLRQIGAELAVSDFTIRRDLARWERQEVEKLLRDQCDIAAISRSDISHEEGQ